MCLPASVLCHWRAHICSYRTGRVSCRFQVEGSCFRPSVNLEVAGVRQRLGQDIPVPVMFLSVVREAWHDRLIELLGLFTRLGEVSSSKVEPSPPAWLIRRQEA